MISLHPNFSRRWCVYLSRHGWISTFRDLINPVLAACHRGAAALSDRLVASAAVPHRRYRGGRRTGFHLGAVYFAGAGFATDIRERPLPVQLQRDLHLTLRVGL